LKYLTTKKRLLINERFYSTIGITDSLDRFRGFCFGGAVCGFRVDGTSSARLTGGATATRGWGGLDRIWIISLGLEVANLW